jgi:hypothetical protein
MANASRTVEDAFPCRVVGDFVDDENMLHEVVGWIECTSRGLLILVEMLSPHQIHAPNA